MFARTFMVPLALLYRVMHLQNPSMSLWCHSVPQSAALSRVNLRGEGGDSYSALPI